MTTRGGRSASTSRCSPRPPRRPGPGPQEQLIRYAGTPLGRIVPATPRNVDSPTGHRAGCQPPDAARPLRPAAVMISGPATRAESLRDPPDAVLEVTLRNPEYGSFAGPCSYAGTRCAGDQQHALKSSRRPSTPAAPFNQGWYLNTEIGAPTCADADATTCCP